MQIDQCVDYLYRRAPFCILNKELVGVVLLLAVRMRDMHYALFVGAPASHYSCFLCHSVRARAAIQQD